MLQRSNREADESENSVIVAISWQRRRYRRNRESVAIEDRRKKTWRGGCRRLLARQWQIGCENIEKPVI